MKLYYVLLELLQKPLSHHQRFFTYFLICSLFMCNFVKVDVLAENLFDDRISLAPTPVYQNVEFVEYMPLKIDIFSKIINTSLNNNNFNNNINLQAENSYYQPQISYNKNYKTNNYIKYSSNNALNINYPVFEDSFINNLFDIKIRDLVNNFIEEVNKYETNSIIKNNDKAQFNLDSNLYFLDESLLFMKFEVDVVYDKSSLPIKYYEMYIYDLQTKQEVSLENFVFGDYVALFVEEAISYFENTYNISLNESSLDYEYLQPTDINYNRIFLNENFVEVVIYDYIINREVLLQINLDKLQGVINPQYLTSSIMSMIDLNQVTPTLIQNQGTTDLVEITTEVISTEPLTEVISTEPLTEVTSTEPLTEVISTEPLTEITSTEPLTEVISTEPLTEITSTEPVTLQEQTVISTNELLETQTTITAEQTIITQDQAQNQAQVQDTPLEAVDSVLPNGIRELEKNKPMVALTFDDGPSYNSTNQILDILEEYNSLATFFVIGSRLDANAETFIRTAEAGHQIGNHTYNHQNLTKYGSEDIKNEILISNEKILSILGEEPSIVRVPYGATNDVVRESIDYPIIAWNRDPRDWELRDAQGVQEAVLSNVVDGDIILMHDLYMSTADACLTIIPELVNRGFQLVTVDELMYYRDLTMDTNQVYGSAPSLVQ